MLNLKGDGYLYNKIKFHDKYKQVGDKRKIKKIWNKIGQIKVYGCVKIL